VPKGVGHQIGWLVVLGLALWCFADPPEWLYCQCGYGTVKYDAARIGYGLIAIRALVAFALRERSRGWAAHLLLLPFIAPLVAEVVTAAGGH
jgi:hypothetical protein